MIKRLKQSV